jgi:flagellar basal-body rod protein FlgB
MREAGMFIEKLINQGNAPLIERMMRFTAARHRLIAENIANVSTPDYQQKDLSMPAFQQMLRDRVAQRRGAPPGSVSFDDIEAEMTNPDRGILFHDRNNRSMEQLMSDLSGNAMRHNMFAEMLRKQYDGLHNVLKERVS